MEAFSNPQIARQRLLNQQIEKPEFTSVAKLISYLAAIQAQDFAMAKWAIGSRIPGSTVLEIDQALQKGEIVRTHILRPTWHFVAGADLRWMLELTAPHVRRLVASGNRKLELTEKVLSKTKSIIEKSLEGNNHLTRKEIMTILETNGITTNKWRSTYIMFDAELSGLVCSGINKGKQITYSLIDETISSHAYFDNEEALAELTFRYFNSRGPATIADFCWWSGLTLTKAGKGVELNSKKLESFKTDSQIFYFTGNFEKSEPQNSLHFLPAFDEFLISYKDRSASMDTSHYKKVIAGYGIFKPLIVKNGFVSGTWQRTIKKDEVRIELNFLDKTTKTEFDKTAAGLETYGKFLDKKVVIVKQ